MTSLDLHQILDHLFVHLLLIPLLNPSLYFFHISDHSAPHLIELVIPASLENNSALDRNYVVFIALVLLDLRD